VEDGSEEGVKAGEGGSRSLRGMRAWGRYIILDVYMTEGS
jgi:hypothetical protein